MISIEDNPCVSFVNETTKREGIGAVTYGTIECTKCQLLEGVNEVTGRFPEDTHSQFTNRAMIRRFNVCPVIKALIAENPDIVAPVQTPGLQNSK